MKPKILVACDFGPASTRALDGAVALARGTGGSMHALESVAERVVRRATVPVVTVRAAADDDERAPE